LDISFDRRQFELQALVNLPTMSALEDKAGI
jgi:hypothetical protein